MLYAHVLMFNHTYNPIYTPIYLLYLIYTLYVTGTVGDLDSPMSPDQKGFASMGQVSYLARVYYMSSILECI